MTRAVPCEDGYGRRQLFVALAAAVAIAAAAFGGALAKRNLPLPPELAIGAVGAWLLTALPLAVLRRTAFHADDPPRWLLWWVFGQLSVLGAVMLLLIVMLVEAVVTGAVTASLRALFVLLPAYAVVFLYGRTAINLLEAARRWRTRKHPA